jgi:hypothetical protein
MVTHRGGGLTPDAPRILEVADQLFLFRVDADDRQAAPEELHKAGVLLDASGLQPSTKGWRIKYCGGQRTVVDGPFAETKELVAGYTLIQVKSRDEALEWTKRFPNPQLQEGEIEVRQLYELEDFAQSESIERFRDMGMGLKH